MSVRSVIRKFKKHKPKSLEDILRLFDCLEYVSRGSFRVAYRIDHLPLIVKVATENKEDESFWGECIDHHLNEMDAIRRVKQYKKYASIRKYLPKLYYYDNKNGIILMPEYPQPITKNIPDCIEQAAKEISKVYNKEFDTWKNFTQDNKGRAILLDWGILGQKTEWIEVETGVK